MPGRAAPVSRGSFTSYSPPKGFSLTKQGHPGCDSGAIWPVSPSPGLGLPPVRIPRLSTSHPSPAPPECRFPAGWSRRSGNPVCLMGKQCGFEGRGQMLGDKKGLLSSGSWGWHLPPLPAQSPARLAGGPAQPQTCSPFPGPGWGAANPTRRGPSVKPCHQTRPDCPIACHPAPVPTQPNVDLALSLCPSLPCHEPCHLRDAVTPVFPAQRGLPLTPSPPGSSLEPHSRGESIETLQFQEKTYWNWGFGAFYPNGMLPVV